MTFIKKITMIFIVLVIFVCLIITIDILKIKINSITDISNLSKVTMYDDNGEVFYEINNLHESSYVKLEDIGENIIKTMIEIEDKRFFKHQGYDTKRIIKAFFHNITSDTTIGASTITQQYVKNIYLSNEKTYKRKLKELYFSMRLETIYTKNQILEGYLNTIYFNHGIYGIYDAAKYYFNKEPLNLSIAEASVLTAIIKSPSTYSPVVNYQKNKERKEIILKTLYNNDVITKIEYLDAMKEEINITKTKYKKYSSTVLFYKDIVLKEIEKVALKGQNIEIYTSFNKKLNENIDNYLNKNKTQSEIGIIVLDNEGNIKASTNKNYYDYPLNTTINSNRMIGSTIKPFLYYEALNYGLSPLSTFKSEPTTFYINKEPYTFQNYQNHYENKKITMGYAIATSDNIYAMKTHLYIGSKKLIKFLNKFDVDVVENYPSLALGTAEMSLLKLTSIYNTFSRMGTYSSPKTINYIKINNKKYFLKTSKTEKKLSDSSTYIINELLTNTFDLNLGGSQSPTGASIAKELNTKVSGKTGLTDYDSYMIGYTPLYTVGVWSGNLDGSLLLNNSSKIFPKRAFLNIMNLLSEQNKNIWYKQPNDVYSIFASPTGFDNNYFKNIYLKH